MHKAKLVTGTILALLVAILILQNSASVETRFLFWTLTMPRAVLLVGTLLIGFALGVITTLLSKRSEGRRPRP